MLSVNLSGRYTLIHSNRRFVGFAQLTGSHSLHILPGNLSLPPSGILNGVWYKQKDPQLKCRSFLFTGYIYRLTYRLQPFLAACK